MKTYKNLFKEVYSFQNLHLAYLKARKCKRYRKDILKFTYNLEENLLKLKEELLNQTYQHGEYKEFIVCDSKKRHIKAAPFRDRVVHHALCNIIESIFDKGFIYDSYACRKNKGTHRTIKRLDQFVKSADDKLNSKIYCLQCDVSKYFDSINHNILSEIIRKKIADQKILWLTDKIISSSQEKRDTGIPIGNLTSQLFANAYLDELDQFIKHQLKIKYYLRYMDDFLILGCEKKELNWIKEKIKEFLKIGLKLDLHPKKANIFPINKGISFLGYRIFKNYKLLKKETIKRFIKRIKVYKKRLNEGTMTQKKFNNSLQSWLSYADFANSNHLIKIFNIH